MKTKMKNRLIGLGITLLTVANSAYAQTPSESYKWLESYDRSNALENRIAPPDGYVRSECAQDSFCKWLREIPLKPSGSPVRYHDGDIKSYAQHFAVLNLDTGKKNLQQCADAVMRLKAEYHFSKNDYTNIHFNYTSGHKVSFDDWRKGRKPLVKGNKVSFTPAGHSVDSSYRNFRKYMDNIFMYAGTLSLSKELERVSVRDIQLGDVFIVGGSPGHAVLVTDVAENEFGKKMFLLAQSYMPAQDMHILKNPSDGALSPWYSADFFGVLHTPDWSFSSRDLMRFKN